MEVTQREREECPMNNSLKCFRLPRRNQTYEVFEATKSDEGGRLPGQLHTHTQRTIGQRIRTVSIGEVYSSVDDLLYDTVIIIFDKRFSLSFILLSIVVWLERWRIESSHHARCPEPPVHGSARFFSKTRSGRAQHHLARGKLISVESDPARDVRWNWPCCYDVLLAHCWSRKSRNNPSSQISASSKWQPTRFWIPSDKIWQEMTE